MTFSPEGKTILTGSNDRTVRQWDMQGNTVQEFKRYTKKDTSVAISSDKKSTLTSPRESMDEDLLKSIDENPFAITLKEVHAISSGFNSVLSVAFSPEGKTILTGSRDSTASLWTLQGKMVQEFNRHKNRVTSVAFSPDGKTILNGSNDRTVRLWDLQRNTVQEFKGHIDAVISVAFSRMAKPFSQAQPIKPPDYGRSRCHWKSFWKKEIWRS